jgi:hypothetical protein
MRKKVLSGYVKAYTDCSFKRLLDLRAEQLKAVTREDIGELVNFLDPVIRVRMLLELFYFIFCFILMLIHSFWSGRMAIE